MLDGTERFHQYRKFYGVVQPAYQAARLSQVLPPPQMLQEEGAVPHNPDGPSLLPSTGRKLCFIPSTLSFFHIGQ